MYALKEQNTSKTKVEILQTIIDNTCFHKKKTQYKTRNYPDKPKQ